MRHAARTDATQDAIIDALRRIGVSVEVIGEPVDLMIYVPRRKATELMEVKAPRPTSEGGRHGLTQQQVKFIARWPGPVHIVESVEQALKAVLGEAMR